MILEFETAPVRRAGVIIVLFTIGMRLLRLATEPKQASTARQQADPIRYSLTAGGERFEG
jgi:hypothetical protein